MTVGTPPTGPAAAPEAAPDAVFRHPARHKVAVLVRHGLLPIELGIPHRIFGIARDPSAAEVKDGQNDQDDQSDQSDQSGLDGETDDKGRNDRNTDTGADARGEPLYEVVTCTVTPGALRTDGDFTVNVAHGPEALAAADTVIVPASHERDETFRAGRLDPGLAAALRRIRPGTRIASICTGAFVLAAAGLLDGRRATTHWSACERLQRLHPAVDVDPDVLYVADGDVLTSAGVASGVDLCLHMVREDFGAEVANAVARRTVVPPHRDGGQAQFVERPVPRPGVHTTGTARAWALRHLERPVTLRELADREAMSVRTFTRRFRAETGMSPQVWLTRQRIERARRLLEGSGLPVDRVARDAGFGSAASLRVHFQSALGVSPSAYRRTFRVRTADGGRTRTGTGSAESV